MADKAIYSVDTVTSMSGTDKVYVNTGNNIKQITKDNLWGNYGDGIKNDLSDYGLNNIFDGVWTQQGEYVVSNFFPVKPGDKIKLIYSDSSKLITLNYYDSSQNGLGNIEYEIGSIFTIPNNSSYIMISIKAVTVDTAGHIGVYVNNQIDAIKNDVDTKYVPTFYLGSNSSTTFDISGRVKIHYPIMIMVYPVNDQPGIWNYVGVIMPSSLNIYIVTLNSSNIEITMDSNYIITVKNTNADWGTYFKMRLI